MEVGMAGMMAGFKSHAHFTRSFKKRHGFPLSESGLAYT